MSVMLPLLALTALALIVLNVVQCVRVWRIADLPLWRRGLPVLLFCCALAATVTRVRDGGTASHAFVLALNMSAPVLASFELDQHRKRRAARPTEAPDAPEASGSAA
ncbi:hypothetical protein ACF09C_05250 [Streptomyces sp. NPDC014870]|uniref:hypothetical protein n=1 Tax=Streptomyces sp. NPDC014870 TaxID=3364925 RepID=UPI0036FC01FA